MGVFMYNYFKKLLPKSFNDFFTTRSDVHNYITQEIEAIITIQETRRFLRQNNQNNGLSHEEITLR